MLAYAVHDGADHDAADDEHHDDDDDAAFWDYLPSGSTRAKFCRSGLQAFGGIASFLRLSS